MCERCSRLLSAKELAGELRKNVSYVYAMKAAGFPLVAGLATLASALDWLTAHPHPRAEKRRTVAKRKTGPRS